MYMLKIKWRKTTKPAKISLNGTLLSYQKRANERNKKSKKKHSAVGKNQ